MKNHENPGNTDGFSRSTPKTTAPSPITGVLTECGNIDLDSDA